MAVNEPGLSWIEIKKAIHLLSADDECHSQIGECRGELLRPKENMELLYSSFENELLLSG